MTYRDMSYDEELSTMPKPEMLEPGHGFWFMAAFALSLGLWLMILAAWKLT